MDGVDGVRILLAAGGMTGLVARRLRAAIRCINVARKKTVGEQIEFSERIERILLMNSPDEPLVRCVEIKSERGSVCSQRQSDILLLHLIAYNSQNRADIKNVATRLDKTDTEVLQTVAPIQYRY